MTTMPTLTPEEIADALRDLAERCEEAQGDMRGTAASQLDPEAAAEFVRRLMRFTTQNAQELELSGIEVALIMCGYFCALSKKHETDTAPGALRH